MSDKRTNYTGPIYDPPNSCDVYLPSPPSQDNAAAGKLAEDVHAHITTQAARIAALEAALAAKDEALKKIVSYRWRFDGVLMGETAQAALDQANPSTIAQEEPHGD